MFYAFDVAQGGVLDAACLGFNCWIPSTLLCETSDFAGDAFVGG